MFEGPKSGGLPGAPHVAAVKVATRLLVGRGLPSSRSTATTPRRIRKKRWSVSASKQRPMDTAPLSGGHVAKCRQGLWYGLHTGLHYERDRKLAYHGQFAEARPATVLHHDLIRNLETAGRTAGQRILFYTGTSWQRVARNSPPAPVEFGSDNRQVNGEQSSICRD